MAEKRMFTLKIVDSDPFLEMPLSTQALYFHLNMRADDDGFVNGPRRIARTIGASDDDLKLLLMKRFIIGFDSGVIVIKHWRMHNTLRMDRYNPTQYQEEYQTLTIKENKSYTDKPVTPLLDDGCQMVANWLPDGCHSIDKVSIEENSIEKNSIDQDSQGESEGGFDSQTDSQKTVNYEGLIRVYLRMGNRDAANAMYQDAKRSGILIDVEKIKKEEGLT